MDKKKIKDYYDISTTLFLCYTHESTLNRLLTTFPLIFFLSHFMSKTLILCHVATRDRAKEKTK